MTKPRAFRSGRVTYITSHPQAIILHELQQAATRTPPRYEPPKPLPGAYLPWDVLQRGWRTA